MHISRLSSNFATVKRYFIHLSYDGTRYHGWQVQPRDISVQGEVERCLSILLQRTVSVTGAGRTDTGVHAAHMVAHFDFPNASIPDSEGGDIPGECDIDEEQLVYRLNRMLPPDIVVYRIEPVADDMHDRPPLHKKARAVAGGQSPCAQHYVTACLYCNTHIPRFQSPFSVNIIKFFTKNNYI